MKTLLYLSLAHSAQASVSLISSSLGQMRADKHPRDNGPWMGRNIQSVSYGCWCFFEEMPIMTGQKKPFKPRGKPVDKLDGYCKELNEAYDCIGTDAAVDKQGNQCEARYADSNLSDNWWVDIGFNLNEGPLPADQLRAACKRLNDGFETCEMYACMVEATFLMRFWDKNEDFFNDEDFNRYGKAWDTYGENIDYEGNFYDYDGYVFDPDVECQTSGTGGLERECCGDYPKRFFYRPRDGAVGCCNGVTFDTMFHECCRDDDGTTYVGDVGCST